MLTAPETIDITTLPANFNGSRDLTTPFQLRWFAIHSLALATVNLRTKFEVSISTHYEGIKAIQTAEMGWFQ